MLDPLGYTLRQAWEVLYQAIVDANDLANCQTLINWLRVAVTGTTIARNVQDWGPTALVLDLTAPLADAVLIQHCTTILKQALPTLYQPHSQPCTSQAKR
jgi:hypothetical protein